MVEVGWQFLDLGPFQCTQMALIRCGPDVGILAEDITGLSRPSTDRQHKLQKRRNLHRFYTAYTMIYEKHTFGLMVYQ
jgi:hypothetical protein